MAEQQAEPPPSFILLGRMNVATVCFYGLVVVAVLVAAFVGDQSSRALYLPGFILFNTVVSIFVRGIRASLYCDAFGVEAKIGPLFRKPVQFRWANITSFEYRRWRGVGVRLTDGTWECLVQFGPFGRMSPQEATDLLEQQRLRFTGGRQ